MRLFPLPPLCVLILFTTYFSLIAQKQNNVWYFGHNAGLDFNTDLLTPLEGELYTLEGNASISDSEGGLLLYTNGATVWDRHHDIMPNGEGLRGGQSSTQAALIVPLPKSNTKYFLFTTGDYSFYSGMSYSVIDILLNDGYGDIISSTKNTLVIDSTAEMLTAILHSNGEDIWIITHTVNSIDFYAYLLTSTGLNTAPIISSIGSYLDYNTFGSFPGPIRNSHDGSKIVCSITYGGICEMFDFNTSTGQLTNHHDLTPVINELNVYGVEFSPNDSLLYLAGSSTPESANLITQINLYSNPFQTTIVASYPDDSEEFGALQMGPDKRIYHARRLRPFIDVIHQPDKLGLACQYEAESVTLIPGTVSTYGLPNPAPYSFCPNITIGKENTVCEGDTLILVIKLNDPGQCPPLNFIWYDGTMDTIKFITQPGIYWLEVNDSFNTYRDSFLVDSAFRRQVIASICEDDSYEGYTETGTYIDTFSSHSGCDSIRELQLTVNQYFRDTIEGTICLGDSVLGYAQTGIYADTFPNNEGCPSIRVLKLTALYCSPIVPIVAYDLDGCKSVMADGSHMDYSEFIPAYPTILPCAEVTAINLNRSFPEKHSCTPGFNGSPAMCVTVFDSCGYQPGNPASVIIEFTINPAMDSIVRFTSLEFYEKSPSNYEWINGPGGVNNFPRYFGLRILKNGEEIYRRLIFLINRSWTLRTFDFVGNKDFIVDSITNFRIELLPYCPATRESDVSVWDIDEVRIYAGCLSPSKKDPVIDGIVITKKEQAISNANIYLSEDPQLLEKENRKTNDDGYYVFDSLVHGKSYYLEGYKNDDVRNGISTLDLICIQKHLLGIEPFTTLDQYVAADINRSGNVSVIDLIELRKLILGRYNAFPDNTSWRFGALPQDFTGIDLSIFEEIKTIESLTGNHEEVNFLGIKIGDLNGDARWNTGEIEIKSRSHFPVSLLMEDQKFFEGQPIAIPVRSGNDVNMEGLQFTLDIRNFNLQTIIPGIISITDENFLPDHNGLLRMSWNGGSSVAVQAGDILFTILLFPGVSGQLKNKLHLVDDFLLAQCYSTDDRIPLEILLDFENPLDIGMVSPKFEIESNPFQSTFNLRFNLELEGKVVFRIYDGAGRQIHFLEKIYSPGKQIEVIELNTSPGVIYCQMISNGNTGIQKAIKMN